MGTFQYKILSINDPEASGILFFSPPYFAGIQKEIIELSWQNKDISLRIHASVVSNGLKSLPMSPFGGCVVTGMPGKADFIHFGIEIKNYLRSQGLETLQIIQPVDIYTRLADAQQLIEMDCQIILTDDHQYIELTKEIALHQMEVRNLQKLEKSKVEVREISPNEWQKLYDKLAESRERKKLKINISFDRLQALKQSFPGRYEGWIAEKNGEWLAGLIAVKITEEVVYYYLPGTFTQSKWQHAMVMLLHHTAHHYRNEGFVYYDLGISSINGIRQDGLFTFKQRMGAQSGQRLHLILK